MTHLSMPDPCPHYTRLDIIRLRLNDPCLLDLILEHIRTCPGESFLPDLNLAYDSSLGGFAP